MRRPALALLFAAVWLSGCGKVGDAPGGQATKPPGAGQPRRVIGVSVLTLTNPFFQVIADTIKAEAARHGYDVVIVSGEEDVARQHNQVKDFIVNKVAAIVLCPCNAHGI